MEEDGGAAGGADISNFSSVLDEFLAEHKEAGGRDSEEEDDASGGRLGAVCFVRMAVTVVSSRLSLCGFPA